MRIRSSTRRGFTVIELLVVLAAIALLVSVAAPRFVQQVDRAREAALRSNLATMRDAIDKFQADRGTLPQTLDELVQARYLRSIPVDPFTERTDTWTVSRPPASASGQVADVHSGTTGTSRNGTAYASW